MSNKGFANVFLIVLGVILAVACLTMIPGLYKDHLSKQPSPQTSLPQVSLDEEFTLKKNQTVEVIQTGLQLTITDFFNSECPEGAVCILAGQGVAFEYELNGVAQSGIDPLLAFGHHVEVIETDHETYATLIVYIDSISEGPIDLCGIAGSTFTSVDLHEAGEQPDGSTGMGHWQVSFGNDGTFSWKHSDYIEAGTYFCEDGAVAATFEYGEGLPTHTINAYYDALDAVLTWEGVEYVEFVDL